MKKIFSTIMMLCLFSVSLVGCATDYKLYADSVEKISIAKSNAEAEKYKAMSLIAGSGSDAAKVAAVMSMAIGNQGSQQYQLQAPKSAGDTALQWLGLIVPSVVQGYSIHSQSMMSIRQSDNNARIAESTNNAFVGIAGKIQAPVAFIPQANITTTTNTDNHAITGSYNPATTSTTSSVATTTTTTTTGSNNPSTSTDSHNSTAVPLP